MKNNPKAHREGTLGTEVYVADMWQLYQLFASPVFDVRSKIVLASKVYFFFKLWMLWFTHGNHAVGNNSVTFKPVESFVSQQCFLDV